jgi:hypothetical protein
MTTPDKRERRAYRAPEMAGEPYVLRPDAHARGDDVIRQPGTMGALLVAVGLIVGLGFLFASSWYEVPPIMQSRSPISTPAPTPN